jgi:hypothetical protein
MHTIALGYRNTSFLAHYGSVSSTKEVPMSRFPRSFSLCAALVALLFALPMSAAVTTVYTCAIGSNQDSIANGVLISGLNATNIHTVTMNYLADTAGTYSITLAAVSGSFGGTLLGSQTQNVALGSSPTPVTWSFGDAPFTPGSTLALVHQQNSGPGEAEFNMTSDLCAGDTETVGHTSTSNGFSVSIAITDNVNTVPSCTSSSSILCIDDQLNDKRFQVSITFATTQDGGKSGNGHAIQTNSLGVDQGGMFSFFDNSNPEVLVKVLNGCGVNHQHWVFFAALTNVGFHMTVTDKTTGKSVEYSNNDNTTAIPVQDTSAFACP